jgi:tRNA nucleotidyltransferase (CCA-adding enzyme)
MGHRPGPWFSEALDAAYEAQLDGAFADEPAAEAWLRAWVAAHRRG